MENLTEIVSLVHDTDEQYRLPMMVVYIDLPEVITPVAEFGIYFRSIPGGFLIPLQ
jgi:hypothetical protein